MINDGQDTFTLNDITRTFAGTVNFNNFPHLRKLPALPNAISVFIYNCPKLTELPELPVAKNVVILDCPGLTHLPALPSAIDVAISRCVNLAEYAGRDSRGYGFYRAIIRGRWHIVAGCRNFDLATALNHWGTGGPSDRPDCLALVHKLIAQIDALPEKGCLWEMGGALRRAEIAHD